MEGTVTVEDLTLAIKNSIDKNVGMEEEQAYMLARHVLNFFGYSDRIIDNILEPEDRDAFYMLEDAGLLTTEREETTLYDGREWRIHYWLFRKDRIKFMMDSDPTKAAEEVAGESVIYEDLPSDIWRRKE
jgi:DNA-binding transcriptional ArsR family regulator